MGECTRLLPTSAEDTTMPADKNSEKKCKQLIVSKPAILADASMASPVVTDPSSIVLLKTPVYPTMMQKSETEEKELSQCPRKSPKNLTTVTAVTSLMTQKTKLSLKYKSE